MKRNPCELLDAYIDDQLPLGEHGDFVKHLERCISCRSELDAQQRVDQLLRAPATSPSVLPAGLTDQIWQHVQAQVRRRRRISWSLSLAAMLLVGMALALTRHGRPSHPEGSFLAPHDESIARNSDRAFPGPGVVADISGNEREPAARKGPELAVSKPEVTVDVDSADYLAVPVRTSNPNVTILWLHPTIKPDKPEPRSGSLPPAPDTTLTRSVSFQVALGLSDTH